ncbi:MAG: hypothetical protein Q3982_06910 [Phoenicibacter congonensis]|uniref:Uncharacterized protein n=1 Tax=Phoenicibacter congonensis TaxID=1944646 RepID=A0AA43RMM4_9ACTN|nr:hypothetical protein [Phoenicibacter congonensis]
MFGLQMVTEINAQPVVDSANSDGDKFSARVSSANGDGDKILEKLGRLHGLPFLLPRRINGDGDKCAASDSFCNW